MTRKEAMQWAVRSLFSYLDAEGKALIKNGDELCKMGDVWEGRCRINVGLALSEAGECLFHDFEMSPLHEIKRKTRALARKIVRLTNNPEMAAEVKALFESDRKQRSAVRRRLLSVGKKRK